MRYANNISTRNIYFFFSYKKLKVSEGGKERKLKGKIKYFNIANLHKKTANYSMHCNCRNNFSLSTVVNNKIKMLLLAIL